MKKKQLKQGLLPPLDDRRSLEILARVERYVQEGNSESLLQLVFQKLESLERGTAFFRRAYTLSSVLEASDYFKDDFVSFLSPYLLGNLVKVALTSILEKTMQRILGAVSSPAHAYEMLEIEAKKILSVQIEDSVDKRTIANQVPETDNFVHQTIRAIVKAYTPEISGKAGKI